MPTQKKRSLTNGQVASTNDSQPLNRATVVTNPAEHLAQSYFAPSPGSLIDAKHGARHTMLPQTCMKRIKSMENDSVESKVWLEKERSGQPPTSRDRNGPLAPKGSRSVQQKLDGGESVGS